jgi:DNA-binding transcriptional ArsR family regulator
MATEGTAESDESEEPWGDRDVSEKRKFQVRIGRAGYDDALHTFEHPDERVLTKRRLEIVRHLADDEEAVASIRDLARQLDRNVSAVATDLDLLVTHGLLTYEQQGNRKVPTLQHENVFVTPLLLHGEFQWEFAFEDEGEHGDEAPDASE